MIKKFFDKHFEKYPEKFLVAVSGGVDSMALTFMLADFCRENGVELMAVTVDHGMREGSLEEARATGDILANSGISHEILTIENAPSSNIEANLRQARYDLLVNFAKEIGAKHIFTAHHKDDLAENFLIRLFRGSQLDGLSGMDEVSEINGVKLCRPLLNSTKKELTTYLSEKNIEWFEDESNADERFLRNKIRNFLQTFEEKDLITDRISRFSEVLKGFKDVEDEELLKEAKESVIFVKNGSFIVNLPKYRKIDRKIALKILSLVMAETSQNGYKPRLEGLKRFEDDVLNLEKSKKRDFYGCQAKLLTKNNYSEALKNVSEVEKWQIIENPNEFLWIYRMENVEDFRFRTILKNLSS